MYLPILELCNPIMATALAVGAAIYLIDKE